MVCSVAGITADANVLVSELRSISERYRMQYGDSIPCEQLVSWLCDVKQAYTQYGGNLLLLFFFKQREIEHIVFEYSIIL